MILDILKNKKYDFTIKEIYEELNQEVGLTTIYRLINKLVNEIVNNKSSYSLTHEDAPDSEVVPFGHFVHTFAPWAE